jgi:Protein kinase domain
VTALDPGATFGGYVIERRLGRGGMGAVYLATHERLGRKAALKVIAPELAHDEEFRARFLRESELAASLDHPNVIPIYDAGEIEGVLYLAMRYVPGPSLQAVIRAGTLTPERTLGVVRQIAGALDAAHEAGLVHRDVKPANILVAEPGEHAYLCDFGLARRTSAEGATQTGFFLGTVDYCAPEQIQGGPVDGRADVYSLGGVLYHCLAGEPPYVRPSEFAVLQAHLDDPPPTLPALPAVNAVLARAMAKDPAERYPTARALADAFASALAGREAETVRLPRPGARRRPWLRWGAIAAALVVAALAVTGGVLLATRDSSPPASAPTGPPPAEVRTFVDRVENVLTQSSAGRKEIGAALTAGFDCTIAPGDAARRIASVADNRQSILVQLGTLDAPTPETEEAVTLLQSALQHSIEADRHYRDGFLAVAPGECAKPDAPDFVRAAASNHRADAAKEAFAERFNELARGAGRKTWSPDEI